MNKREKQYQDSAKIMVWIILCLVAFSVGYLFIKIANLYNHL